MVLPQLRRIPAWVPSFLRYIELGRGEKVAANLAQVGTDTVKRLVEKDPKFKIQYEQSWAKRKQTPQGGH